MGGTADRALTVYFDFASPYAYVAFDAVVGLAEEAGLRLDPRPAMVWAILKARGIAAPLEAPVRRDYLLADMARSAAFHGLPYREPATLPISAHLASRMWLGFAADDGAPPLSLARAIYAARFVEGLDIRDTPVLRGIAAGCGHDPYRAEAHMQSDVNKAALARTIDEAVGLGVPGIPCMILGSELFFGADRLPQLRWRLGLGGGAAS